MDCTRTRERLIEWELGLLPEETERAIVAHVDRCPACAQVARAERALSAGLLRLRVEPPFRVDVSARVMAEIARVPRRHLAWALASAAAGAVVVAMGLVAVAPQGRAFLTAAWTAVLWVVSGAVSLVTPAVPYAVAAGRFLAGLGLAAWDLAVAGAHLEPEARPFIVISVAVMLAASMYVIARDLRSRPDAPAVKEQP